MNTYFAYIRVSTAKQGTRGVSLEEQRDAIKRYGERNDLKITKWFEERETAAKSGRPIFSELLELLARGEAKGVIIHKIDRSARNLRDWANLGELLDRDTEVHFANESLDMHSRGGRLSADIQAVVAADFIRNLREETKKGFYGRLKQGLYPLPAPPGYLNNGKGQLKTIDPIRGPLVAKAFELYSTGRYSLESLAEELHRLGFCRANGLPISRNGMSVLLKNPFYAGVIRLKKSGECFEGKHKVLINQQLFDSVQAKLSGKCQKRVFRHDFIFRQLFRCKICDRALIGEKQKGNTYYRCHSRTCRGVSLREEEIDATIQEALQSLSFNEAEIALFLETVSELEREWKMTDSSRRKAAELKLASILQRIDKLTDTYLDGDIDREILNRKKAVYIREKVLLEKLIKEKGDGSEAIAASLRKKLELSNVALYQYKTGIYEEKREVLEMVSSNRFVHGKNVVVELSNPYAEIAKRNLVTGGDPCRATARTFLEEMLKYME